MTSNNKYLNDWIKESADFYQPAEIVWYDGSKEAYDKLASQLVDEGVFIPLDEDTFPNSYLARSNPNDVARVEDRTFICSKTPDDAGPTNHWKDPKEAKDMLDGLMKGCMRGRTMYVIPYLMGPSGSSYARFGVELVTLLM